MKDKYFGDFDEYLKWKEIFEVDEFSKTSSRHNLLQSDKNIKEHLKLISEFHSRVLGYSIFTARRLDNSTGKQVEDYKVYIKKLKRDLIKLKEYGPKNCFESTLLQSGDEILSRAEECIKRVYENDYYGLISRSMKRIEVCLGNTLTSNLRGIDNSNSIQVIDTKKCSYDMVECDGLCFLSKLKRGGMELDWESLIEYYCQCEGLAVSSENFIKAMLSFPSETMKCCSRYRYKEKNWSEEEYETRLKKAMERDGEIIPV